MNRSYTMRALFVLLWLLITAGEAKSEYTLEHIFNSLVKIKVLNSDALVPDKSGIIESDYSYGTGFYISEDGLILTAEHLLSKRSSFNTDPITCLDMFTNKAFGPIIMFEDKKKDIAVLKNPRTKRIKHYIDIFANPSRLKKGLKCFCVGFPNELQNFDRMASISLGEIISVDTDLQGYKKLPYRRNVVVSSCDVFSGFSGGLLFDRYYLPIGLILGSIDTNNGRRCFSRRIEHLRVILNDYRK